MGNPSVASFRDLQLEDSKKAEEQQVIFSFFFLLLLFFNTYSKKKRAFLEQLKIQQSMEIVEKKADNPWAKPDDLWNNQPTSLKDIQEIQKKKKIVAEQQLQEQRKQVL